MVGGAGRADDPRQPLAVGVIGCGRMGRLHARAYAEMPQARLAGVHDLRPDAAAAIAGQFSCRSFDKLDDLLEHVQAVSIAVPTRHHAELAEAALRRGLGCLIEKPLARTADEGRRIVELARSSGAIVQVGHIERFNPAILALRRLKLRPIFIDVDRISPMSFRSLDIGVVLDMMIHDLDIVLSLVHDRVARIDASGAAVVGDHEDICNARVGFANGCVANLTASRISMKTERKMRIFSRDGYVSLDYQARQGIVVRRAGNLEKVRAAVERVRRGEAGERPNINLAELIAIEPLQIEPADPLRLQLEAFVEAARSGNPSPVPAEDGLAALELAERIVQAVGPSRL